MEQSLGVRLFRIQGRKTVLTESGILMSRRAEYLLEEAARVEAVGMSLSEGIEDKLRIAVDEVFPQKLLYQVLDNVSKAFPLLRIELMESILGGATELLENSQVDIAVTPRTVHKLFNEELCQIEFVAVASPDNALHHSGVELCYEHLKSHRQIVVRDSSLSSRMDEGWLDAEQRWTVSHMHTSIDMIKNGFGFAWLPIPLITKELEEGSLLPLNLSSGLNRNVQLHLVFNDGDRLGPAARTFLGELRYQSLHLPTAESLSQH